MSRPTASQDDRKPTDDERAGMNWWNALTEAERRHWMRKAGDTGIAADAWAAFQRTQASNSTN